MNLNLGCPDFCNDWVCVDLQPRDRRVIRAEAIDYLKQNPRQFQVIKAYQLIEHLPNVGDFFESAYAALHKHGELRIRTDNAEWPLFYVRLPKGIFGVGAHASEQYRYVFSNGSLPHDGRLDHYAIFTKMHLRRYAERYGFSVVELKRVTFGARLLAVLRKEA